MAVNHATGDARELSRERRKQDERANDRPDDAHAHGIRFVAEIYGTPTDDGVLFQQRFEGGLPGEGEPVFVFPFEVTSRTWRELGEPRAITVTFESVNSAAEYLTLLRHNETVMAEQRRQSVAGESGVPDA